MYYRGYEINRVKGYYKVTGHGEEWTEDTVTDAKATIDLGIAIQEQLEEV